jgi:hypothetical protein
MSATGNRYSIDSSSLIHCRRVYPIDVFPRLWHLLDGLITANRLVAHEEVWQEIHVGTAHDVGRPMENRTLCPC